MEGHVNESGGPRLWGLQGSNTEPIKSTSVSIQLLEPTASVCGPAYEHPQNDELVIKASLRVNAALLLGKATTCVMSPSPAIIASFLDSAVDSLVQLSLFWASRAARDASTPEYPVGRGQLEPVSVVVCSALKCASMCMVLVESAEALFQGKPHGRHFRKEDGGWTTVVILGLICVAKLALCTWCELVVHGRRGSNTETARAIVADNQNDVLFGVGALLAATLGRLNHRGLWWADPVVAIVLAIYILTRWVKTGRQQVEMIIGLSADSHFLEIVREIAETHDPSCQLDLVRAYHFGPRFLVELEVVMDEHTPLRDSHDVGLLLQHKIEALPAVERCFVHVDYEYREADDHSQETPVTRKIHAQHTTQGDGIPLTTSSLFRHSTQSPPARIHTNHAWNRNCIYPDDSNERQSMLA
ncbi:hypothetical protein AB1Y20_002022 [Prymnesium parvum]|uniref:Cation efflux protein transmembrane domain-containing protein n=1 Tax=Prymnesium parvum TaxID=97485 RepID=A0AB34JA25_PRYPA